MSHRGCCFTGTQNWGLLEIPNLNLSCHQVRCDGGSGGNDGVESNSTYGIYMYTHKPYSHFKWHQ